jgi:Domain of unknown function (DUF4082)
VTKYTLFSQTGGGTLTSDANDYTMGVQFSVSQACTLTGIWWYSVSGATALPGTIALYSVSGGGSGTLVHSETPSWSGAAGSGWVNAEFSSPPSLTASTNYKACVGISGVAGNWYSSTSNYWSSGAGSGGITNGPLSAPNNAGGDGGQDTFHAGATLTYPATSFSAGNYWVDPEVQPSGAANTATGSLTVTPAFAVKKAEAHVQAMTVTPAFALVKAEGHKQALTVTPVFSALGVKNFGKGGTPDRHHRRSWNPR